MNYKIGRKRFRPKELADMLMTLIGEVTPVGETNEDDERLFNIALLKDTISYLLDEMYEVCYYSTCYEYSKKRAAKVAIKWFEEKQGWISDFLQEVSHDE